MVILFVTIETIVELTVLSHYQCFESMSSQDNI